MKKRFKGRTFRIEKRRLYGVCDHGDAVITIDTRQRGKELLNTLVHECLHASNPDLSEAVVTRMAN